MTLVVVPVVGPSPEQLLPQVERARTQGADAVELRLDRALAAGGDAAALLAAIMRMPVPVIVTIRHHSEGGGWEGPESVRLALYTEADRLGAAYIDMELAHIEAWHGWRPKRARLILSHHDFSGMGGDPAAVVASMRQAGCAVAKIALTARDGADLAVIERLYRSRSGPLVAIAMGEHGMPSRLLAGIWGAEFTFARLEGDPGSAPGQPTVRELLAYKERWHGPETRIFGVIGSPIAHSLSPLIHNAAFAHHDIDAIYVPFRVEDAVAFWRACGSWMEGCSITLPHKQALLDEVDCCEHQVDALSAMNTIYRSETGGSVGANTDAGSIVRCLEVEVGTLTGRRVLVLGAGGVSRTAAFACAARGALVTITNRTAERARELARELSCPHVPWEQAPASDYQILINGTSVGMGKPDESPWPTAAHRRGSVVFDTVYTPLETRLLRDAGAAGATTVCGLDMFIRQATAQFERWTHLPAPDHLMYRLALERLDPIAAGTLHWRRKATAG
jgi:3-dehydroquinate dehydratase/shikimate dehydrogenase